MNDDLMESFIEIQLFDDATPHVAGRPLEGIIHLHAQKNLNDTARISLTLTGKELASMSKNGEQEALIVQENFEIYSYTNYHDVIQHGMWGYPFKLHLPHWLPQSHLCYDTDEKKSSGKNGKYSKVNVLKIQYKLLARVEGTENNVDAQTKKPCLLVNKLESERKFTVITDSQNLPEQKEVVVENAIKINEMLASKGEMKVKMKLNKDHFFPRDNLKLKVNIDNKNCQKDIERFKCRILRKIEVYKPNTNKAVLTHEHVVMQEEYPATCKLGTETQQECSFQIPDRIFHPFDEEKPKMPSIELDEKQLEGGLSSSLQGQMIKVGYMVQFEVLHDLKQISKTGSIFELPLSIMTPNVNAINPVKPTRDKHSAWNPYQFKQKELTISTQNINAFHEAQFKAKYGEAMLASATANQDPEQVVDQNHYERRQHQQDDGNWDQNNKQEQDANYNYQQQNWDQNANDANWQQQNQNYDYGHDQNQNHYQNEQDPAQNAEQNQQEYYQNYDQNYEYQGYYDEQGNWVNYDQNYNQEYNQYANVNYGAGQNWNGADADQAEVQIQVVEGAEDVKAHQVAEDLFPSAQGSVVENPVAATPQKLDALGIPKPIPVKESVEYGSNQEFRSIGKYNLDDEDDNKRAEQQYAIAKAYDKALTQEGAEYNEQALDGRYTSRQNIEKENVNKKEKEKEAEIKKEIQTLQRQLSAREEPKPPNAGCLRWLILFFVVLSTTGPSFRKCKESILEAHLQFDRDLLLPYSYGNNITITNKHLIMNIDSYIAVIPPLISGLLIDKGYTTIVLIISPILMAGGPAIELLDGRSTQTGIILSHVCYQIGYGMFEIAQIIVLIKWFRDQFSLTLAFALYYSFTPLIASIITSQSWNQLKPVNLEQLTSIGAITRSVAVEFLNKSGLLTRKSITLLDVEKLELVEICLMSLSFASALMMVLINCIADKKSGAQSRASQYEIRDDENDGENNSKGIWYAIKKMELSFYITILFMSLMNFSIQGVFEQLESQIYYKYSKHVFLLGSTDYSHVVEFQIPIFITYFVCAIIVGLIVERCGFRMQLTMLGIIFLAAANFANYAIPACSQEASIPLTKVDQETCWPSTVPHILFAIGFSVYSVVLMSQISYLALPEIQGTAYGILFFLLNLATIIFHIIQSTILTPSEDLEFSAFNMNKINSKYSFTVELELKKFRQNARDSLDQSSLLLMWVSLAALPIAGVAYWTDFKKRNGILFQKGSQNTDIEFKRYCRTSYTSTQE